MTVAAGLRVRVWVPEVWDVVPLTLRPETTVGELREAARQQAGLLEVSEEDIIAAEREREAEEAAEAQGEPAGAAGERDALFREAAETCIQHQLGSTSLLQRRLRIGYGRAARVIDQLHEAGILGPPDGSRPREVLIGMEQLDEYCQ